MAAHTFRNSFACEQALRHASRTGEIDCGRAFAVARTHVRELVLKFERGINAGLRLGRARLCPAPQPLDLALHEIFKRLLLFRLRAQKFGSFFEKFAVTTRRAEEPERVG